MKVQVKFLQYFYQLVGRNKIEVELPENSTLLDLIKYIDEHVFKGFSKIVLDNSCFKQNYIVLVNGLSINCVDEVKLTPNSTIVFMSPVGGG